MSSNTIHILNGDSLRERSLPIKPGETVVSWREMLCEGPSTSTLATKEFWKTRSGYYKNMYGISEEEFDEITVKEVNRIGSPKQYQQIYLWFEYDLFCQLNLVAIVAWLGGAVKEGATLNIVYPVNQNMEWGELTFAEVPDEYFEHCLRNCVTLVEEDIILAQDIWRSYCNPDPRALEFATSDISSAFPFMAKTIHNHFLRFPEQKSGLNILEKRLLQIINEGDNTTIDVMRKILTQSDEFGYGDLQFFKMLDQLEELCEKENGIIKLNELGTKVISGEVSFLEIVKKTTFYGGAIKEDFVRQSDTDINLYLK